MSGYGGYDDGSGYEPDERQSKSRRVQKSLEDYVDVAQRIADFRAEYPEGRLRPVDPANPIKIVYITGWDGQGNKVEQTFLEYTALCYRDADDEMPGVGVAWEIFPGRTTYTRNSEAQNAETSAWGRAIVAALIADARAGVASREEVQNRQAEREEWQDRQRPQPNLDQLNNAINIVFSATTKHELAAAWRQADSFWLLDTQIPGREPGFRYRELWAERRDAMNKNQEDTQHAAGLGEETGDPAVAPQEETGAETAVAAVEGTLDGTVVEQGTETPEASGAGS